MYEFLKLYISIKTIMNFLFNILASSKQRNASIQIPKSNRNERKIVHNFVQRFKKEDKFSENMAKDVKKFTYNNNEATYDYQLTVTQKL